MVRFYFAGLTGTGASLPTAFGAVVRDLLPGLSWGSTDGRANPATGAGRVFVGIDVTPAQHATLIADARITYLPFEGAGGTLLALTDTFAQITLANRNTLTTICEAQHVPITGLVGTDPIRFLVRRITVRYLMRQYLGALDLTEGLDTLVSAIPVARRNTIAARLLQTGFETSDAGVVGTDTVRQAIVKMVLDREGRDQG